MTRTFSTTVALLVLVCGAGAISTPRRALRQSRQDIDALLNDAMGGDVKDALSACGDALASTYVGELGARCSDAYAAISVSYQGYTGEIDLCPEPCKEMWAEISKAPSCLDAYGNIFGPWFGAVCGDAKPSFPALFPEEPASSIGDEAPSSPTGAIADSAPAPAPSPA